MKTKAEIKSKQLELFKSRERFNEICNKDKEKDETLASAFYIVDRIYTEKIRILDWVLDDLTHNKKTK